MTEEHWDVLRRYHGHLGPWLILGVKIGEAAVARVGARRHFGVEVTCRVPDAPPPSCLVDGLQWSTGATYGKRNITLVPSDEYTVTVLNKDSGHACHARVLAHVPELFRTLLELHGDEGASRLVAEMPDADLFELETP